MGWRFNVNAASFWILSVLSFLDSTGTVYVTHIIKQENSLCTSKIVSPWPQSNAESRWKPSKWKILFNAVLRNTQFSN
jgi:hypothetical protein